MYKTSFCFYILCLMFMSCGSVFNDDNDMFSKRNAFNSLTTPNIIIEAGYQCETHHILTEDGFILAAHRIPGNVKNGINQDFPPIILQHGLMDSSAGWVLLGRKKALAFLLADRGYDVWLGNARGNKYSRAHTKLNPKAESFWNWSWHEMGYYDLPAFIDYILNKTKHRKLQYIGHSMGTTMFFVMTSTRPEYNDKISYMVALAPVAFLANPRSPVKYLSLYMKTAEKLCRLRNYGELTLDAVGKSLLKAACLLTNIQKELCSNILFVIAGFDRKGLDLQMLPQIFDHYPAGTSCKAAIHYIQEMKSKKFSQYDHDTKKNFQVYNSFIPPNYNLGAITVPMTLIYGSNDLLATPADVKNLHAVLHDKVKLLKVKCEKFNHVDFLLGRDADILVYDHVIQLLYTKNIILKLLHASLEKLWFTDHNISLIKMDEAERKVDKVLLPKEEQSKTAELKHETKIVTGLSSNLLNDIEEKLPEWQNVIVDKLVSLQIALKELTSKKQGFF